MSTSIICPNCGTGFEPTAALTQSIEAELKKQFNQKWKDELARKDEQFRQREAAIQEELTKQIMQKLQVDYDVKFRSLQEANRINEEKLAESREKELDFLQQMQALKTKEQELEIQMQRKILEERSKLTEIVKKEEEEKSKLRDAEHQMKVKELEKQLEDQRKLAEEMRRKAEQGSMQLQGEVQELALEELLRFAFPFDLVSEVGKGVKGADCIMTIRNNFGQECGKIVFESKRTKDFSKEWIEKIKADARLLGSDAAVIVTQAMPKDMDGFGEKEGVWICNFMEVKAMVGILRDMVIRVYNATKNQENKGDKMTLLYNYLISHEFSGQWKAIREGFMSMKMSIQKERDQMERLWKAREKQLEKVLLNAAHIKGSIEGIAGMESVDLNLIPDEKGNDYLLD
jgi:hypothetical protein